MNFEHFAFTVSLLDMVCWAVCFWWMHRISKNQNFLLDQLREQAKRIEQFSKVEHDLIKEVHPQVGEIREGMEKIVAVVDENSTDALKSK